MRLHVLVIARTPRGHLQQALYILLGEIRPACGEREVREIPQRLGVPGERAEVRGRGLYRRDRIVTRLQRVQPGQEQRATLIETRRARLSL